jgi:multiple sugar transport system ATP-binding protein
VAGFIGSPPMNLIDCSLTEENGKISLDAGPFKIATSDFSRVLNKATSSEVLLGIRPEDIKILRGKVKGKRDFTASIYTIEPLGIETVVMIKAGEEMLRVRLPGEFRASIGDEVGIAFDKQKIYIFDRRTGERCV